MNSNRTSIAFKVVSILLAIVIILPVGVMATETRSSLYLHSYSAYVYPAGWGKVQVWFHVDGTNDMDEIGVLEIYLYESKDNVNWTWVETYQHQNDAGMLGYNNYYHDGHVEYNGTIGRYYKAYVCGGAGKNGDGDTRYFWTSPKKATLFAG